MTAAKTNKRGFQTRNKGYNLAVKVWTCSACNTEHTAQRPFKCLCCDQVFFHVFDSKKEARRYQDLLLMQRAKEIESLSVHPVYPLTGQDVDGNPIVIVRLVPDFRYVDHRLDRLVVEDVKPNDPTARDPVFQLKAKWFKVQYGIDITIYS